MLFNKYIQVALLVSFFIASQSTAAGFPCLIEPNQVVELGSPVNGRIEHVNVKRGDIISKNQIVATIESKAERAAAELANFKSQQVGPSNAAESKMFFSKKKLNRRQTLANQNLMSMQDSEETESEFRVAEAELQIAKENRQIAHLEFQQQNILVNLRTIRSPVEGVVVDQGMFQGEVFESGSNKKYIVKVAQMNPLKIRVILPKNLFGQLKKGENANIFPEIPLGHHYSASINMIDRLIDAASGTFVVFLEMRNPKLEIPVGVKCTVEFPVVGAIK